MHAERGGRHGVGASHPVERRSLDAALVPREASSLPPQGDSRIVLNPREPQAFRLVVQIALEPECRALTCLLYTFGQVVL